MTAEEIMTEDVTTVDETAPVSDAIEILSELEFRHLPVVRGREVVGMLSERDMRTLGLHLVSDLESLDRVQARIRSPVSEIMRSDVLTVGRETDLVDIIDTMVEEKVGALPVLEEETNELVGIVSYVDVLRAARDSIE